ncbi:DUF4236 domain-containing protein [Thiothrix nivea]|uniref:DUF4236 domain-containing protein n=1 Tax=Thiothrix nivea (strain ATCC 35100 / DSM 5205 / JP2) TaxID=870187 RepID=A0A656HGS5_THINJ|nr:hypothetical protein Thini_3718 [Thiothrix nivea DSM 5205]
MGFRFRKSFSIMPGMRLNITHRGASTTIGGNGLTVNAGRRGIRGTASIPGSGLSYSGNIISAGHGAGSGVSASKSPSFQRPT